MIMAPETAFILAAGLGTRMRPLTHDRPKALVEVAGKALIDHMITRLEAAGAKRFVVNVHYFADRLSEHLIQVWGEKIVLSDERDLLRETGGGLKHAAHLLGHEPIFVANIDSVWCEDGDNSMNQLVKLYDPDRMDAALLLAEGARSFGFDGKGDFFLESDAALKFCGEATAAPYNYMGVHITKPDYAARCEKDVFSLTPLWRDSASQGRLFGAVMQGDWMHVGDPEARNVAEARLSA